MVDFTSDPLPGAQVEIVRPVVSETGKPIPAATIGKFVRGPMGFDGTNRTGYVVEVQSENPCTGLIKFESLFLQRTDFVITG